MDEAKRDDYYKYWKRGRHADLRLVATRSLGVTEQGRGAASPPPPGPSAQA